MPAESSEVKGLLSSDSKYAAKSSLDWKRILIVLSVIAAGTFFFFVWGGDKEPHHSEIHQTIHEFKPNDEEPKPSAALDSAGGGQEATAAGTAPETTTKTATKDDDDPSVKTALDTAHFEALKQKLAAAKETYAEKMVNDYGDYYEPMFFDQSSGASVSRGRDLFVSGNTTSTLSWERLVRKVKMKLLSENAKFVWATGGHSATAGHGNFYDESYTAVLHRAAVPLFDAINLEFTGRNYAMGGTAAGPEIALCEEEIFGQDLDVLVWDFGMTDGKDFWKQSLYQYRAGYNKGRPATIAYHTGGSNGRGRINVVRAMENLGLPALISSEAVMDATIGAIPDSFGIDDTEIEKLPLFVRNFRCGAQIEKGDPYCQEEKFNMTICPKRKARTSWHPGWKWQAVMGHLAAFFLIEVLDDALAQLSTGTENLATLRAELQAQEDADYAAFLNAPIPTGFVKMLSATNGEGFDFDLLAKGHTFCHTGKLPAEIRHKGILTETEKTGFTTFDMGISLKEAQAQTNYTGENMRLIKSDREICERTINMDFKDFFYVNKSDDWKKLVLPNDAELKEYGNGEPLKGMVSICFALCAWGKCPKGALSPPDMGLGKFELEINAMKVSNMTSFQECQILKNDEGYIFEPNADGRFDIKARVTAAADDDAYVQFSSFILW